MRNGKNLVSVIIPAYNSEKFISECLGATISQTYRNLEIIIVVKKSTDKTLNVCEAFADTDGRIKIFESDLDGVSVSRNIGIANATGDYVAFFDSDDYPEPDMVECLLDAIDEWANKDVAVISCGMFLDNYLNKYVNKRKSILESGHGYIEGENYLMSRNSAATLSWLKLFNHVTNKIYNLKTIKEHDIKFDEAINIGEDLKFNLDYLEVCSGSIGMVNRPLYHYIKRSNNSLSLTFHSSDIEDTKAIYKQFIEWESKQIGVTDENIMVVKSFYLYDWISRLTTMYEHFRGHEKKKAVKHTLRKEMHCHEFRKLLFEVYKAGKISTFRYLCLKTGFYEVFYFFRGFYQLLKG